MICDKFAGKISLQFHQESLINHCTVKHSTSKRTPQGEENTGEMSEQFNFLWLYAGLIYLHKIPTSYQVHS